MESQIFQDTTVSKCAYLTELICTHIFINSKRKQWYIFYSNTLNTWQTVPQTTGRRLFSIRQRAKLSHIALQTEEYDDARINEFIVPMCNFRLQLRRSRRWRWPTTGSPRSRVSITFAARRLTGRPRPYTSPRIPCPRLLSAKPGERTRALSLCLLRQEKKKKREWEKRKKCSSLLHLCTNELVRRR